jgi:hypothetical protein
MVAKFFNTKQFFYLWSHLRAFSLKVEKNVHSHIKVFFIHKIQKGYKITLNVMIISKLLGQSSKYDTLSYQEKSEGIIKCFYFYYCLQKSLLIIFQVTLFCDLFNVCVRYHDDGSKELNACIRFLLHMVYL